MAAFSFAASGVICLTTLALWVVPAAALVRDASQITEQLTPIYLIHLALTPLLIHLAIRAPSAWEYAPFSWLGWTASAAAVVMFASTARMGELDEAAIYLLTVMLSAATVLMLRRAPWASALAATFAITAGSVALPLLLSQFLTAQPPFGGPDNLVAATASTLLIGVGLSVTALRSALAGAPERHGRLNLFPLGVFIALAVAPAGALTAQMLVSGSHHPINLGTLIVNMASSVLVSAILLWGLNKLARQAEILWLNGMSRDAQAITILDPDGRVLYWSRGCERMFGYRADAAVGQIKHQLLKTRPPVHPARLLAPPSATQIQKQTIEIARDGRELHILELHERSQGADGRDLTIICATDLSPLLDARNAAALSDERLNLALSAHRIGIFEWTRTARKVEWFADKWLFQVASAKVLSTYRGWLRTMQPEDARDFALRLRTAVRKRDPKLSFCYHLIPPSGSARTIEGSARLFYDAHGKLIRMTGAHVDVTDRAVQRLKMAASRAQLRSILETVPSAMIVIDVQGNIVEFSQAAERLFGHCAAAVTGRNVKILMPPEDARNHDHHIARYLQSGSSKLFGIPRIFSARRADGSDFPIELTIGEAVTKDQRVFTGFITDLTDQLRREERLEQLSNELAQIDRFNAMGELAGSLAHEINQPLTAIANNIARCEAIVDDIPKSEQVKRLSNVMLQAREQSLRAGDIVRRMRDFVARHELALHIVSVEETIQEAITLIFVGSQRLDISFNYDSDPNAQFMFADKIQIQQVLINLIRNAIDALRPIVLDQRRISVTTRYLIDDERIEFLVSDNGPGLPNEAVESLFQPFQTKKGEQNMGIGLMICRRIVEAHGGTISAFNNETGGASFRFTVPGVSSKLGAE